MEPTWTILKVLQWTTDYFRRQGIEQPRSTAEILLASVLATERLGLYLRFDQPLRSDELARYRALIRRRAAREPTQYLTGRQEFWSLSLEVTPAVLIPRPETERLVEAALEFLPDGRFAVLDLATGSGAIAIALARERPGWQVTATDLSPEALAVARRNALRHGLGERLRLVAMDLFDAWSTRAPGFDLIVANPPYIGDDEFETLQPEVARFEPSGALRGGGRLGLAMIRRIVAAAPRHLRLGGRLLVEFGMGQDEHLAPLLAGDRRYTDHGFGRDYAGIMRYFWAQTGEPPSAS